MRNYIDLIHLLTVIAQVGAFIFAGYLASRKAQRRGWLFGLTLGLLWVAFNFALDWLNFYRFQWQVQPDNPAGLELVASGRQIIWNRLPFSLIQVIPLTTLGSMLPLFLKNKKLQ